MSVQIYDNFLNKDEFKKLLDEINKREYTWGHGSVGTNQYPWLSMKLTNCEYAHHILKNKIEPTVNMSFDVERIYMNGQMYGCQSKFHTDSSEDNARTFLYFIHEYTSNDADNYGGYFYYKLNNEIKCIEPIQNRGILFNGNMLHKGVAFNRCTGLLRQSIAWKLFIKTDNPPVFTNDETSNAVETSNAKNTSGTENIHDEDKKIHDEILSIINRDNYDNINGLDKFEPLMDILSYKHVINCDKNIIICFNTEDKHTISNIL
jgi:hypothetical protein